MEGVNWFYASLGLTISLVIAVLFLGFYVSLGGIKGEALVRSFSSGSEASVLYDAIFVGDQVEGSSVVVSLLTNKKPGFVVIQEEEGGKPGRPVGVSDFLNAGERSRIVLDLVRPLREGERLYAIIYEDNGDKAFDIRTDKRVESEEGREVMMSFIVTDGESQPTSVTI